MTVQREYTVKCDECYCWERYQVSNQRTARKKARSIGWACGSHGDYCPECNGKSDTGTDEFDGSPFEQDSGVESGGM